MSWDVFIMRFPADVTDPRAIPSDWEPPPIGTNAEVRSTIRRVLPDLKLGPDGYSTYDGPGFALEAYLGGDDQEEAVDVILHFYGSGAAAGLALEITEAFDARAIETGAGGFLERAKAGESWEAWQRYRDHVLDQAAAETDRNRLS